YYRGWAHALSDDDEQAMADANQAIALDPKSDRAYTLRGWLHLQNEDFDRAIADCTQAIALDPTSGYAYATRASVYEEQKQFGQALADDSKACDLDAKAADAHNGLAWVLATCPESKTRNGASALEHAQDACQLTDYKDAVSLDTLAAAYAECGKFKEAVDW